MKQLALVLGLLVVTAGGSRLVGQTTNEQAASAERRGLWIGFGPAGSTISSKPNAPFRAVAVESFEQTLQDGTNISRENKEIVMRDSEGRIYRGREIKRPFSDREPLILFSVTDPAKQVQFRCNQINQHCTISPYRQPPSRTRFPDRKHLRDVTFEDLGDSNISGMAVVGQRITRVIPEGTAGNDRPFESTEEIWRSKELEVDVEVKRSDPRFGVRTTMLTQLDLAEPDPKFFQVPEGYKVGQLQQPTGAFAPLPQSGLPAISQIAPGIP